MTRFFCALALLVAFTSNAEAQKPAVTGTDVLRRMHDAYANKWYKTLTFKQTTTQYPPNAQPRVTTWLESLRHDATRGTQLRIDIGDPAQGNLQIYTPDSTWVVRGSKLVRTVPHGNEFLPLIEGVYVQPVERTARELRSMGFNLERAFETTLEGTPVWVVGAASPTDSTSAQFWVDKERNILVRGVLVPGPNAPPLIIKLGNYVPLEGGWLATKIDMTMGGKPFQTEEYADWKANINVPASLFDTKQWPAAQP